jgi:hypothetical protein
VASLESIQGGIYEVARTGRNEEGRTTSDDQHYKYDTWIRRILEKYSICLTALSRHAIYNDINCLIDEKQGKWRAAI